MGYTHYWELDTESGPISFKPQEVDIFRKILLAGPVQFEDDIAQPPEITPYLVRFNGVGAEGHETFLLDLTKSGFAFCKTARKPYDLQVMCCLIAVKSFLGAHITVSSDGDFDGPAWMRALKYMQDRFDIRIMF